MRPVVGGSVAHTGAGPERRLGHAQTLLLRARAGLFTLRAPEDIAGAPPLAADVWLPQTEVACARDAAGSAQGFPAAIQGRHNAESHNHNDVGTCVVYQDGRP